jgi:hypothetical protein
VVLAAGSREIEHLGSAHDEAELEALKAAAQQRIAAGQPELDLGLEDAAGGDEVFRHLVLARIIEPASLFLYDVSTLYFETDQGDGFREPGFSKERRLEPQITIGLLTGQDGFPLMVSAFEGEQGRDQDHAAGHREVHGRPQAARRHRRRGRRQDLRGQPVSREWNGGTRTAHGRSRTKRTISSLSLKSSGASPSVTSRSATADCLIAFLFRVMNSRE